MGFPLKAPLSLRNRASPYKFHSFLNVTHKTIWNLKEQFDYMSYRFLLRLQLPNLKATVGFTVAHQKCTIISNFDFDLLRVELRPYGSFVFDKTNSKNNCLVRN